MMSMDDEDKPPAPPVRLTSNRYQMYKKNTKYLCFFTSYYQNKFWNAKVCMDVTHEIIAQINKKFVMLFSDPIRVPLYRWISDRFLKNQKMKRRKARKVKVRNRQRKALNRQWTSLTFPIQQISSIQSTLGLIQSLESLRWDILIFQNNSLYTDVFTYLFYVRQFWKCYK